MSAENDKKDTSTAGAKQAAVEPVEHTVSSGKSVSPVLSRISNRVAQVRPAWSGQVTKTVAAALIVGAIAGFFGGWLGAGHDRNTTLNTSTESQRQVVTSESQLLNSIAKTVGPSVVSVNVIGTTQSEPDFFGFGGGSQTEASAGTGIIISTDGLVMTNRHVVPAGTTNVSVTLSDGTELKDVEVVGRTNASDSLDVAFLKIKDTKGKKLTPAHLGDSSKIQVGDAVVAIGNALGQFQNTVTSGIISGFGRSVQASDSGTGQNSESLDDLFQTDAAINEGNSGGPLVNMSGEVIGINTAIAGNAQNVGFAIPINDVAGIVKQVEATGKLQRPYLGVRYVPLTADYAYQYNLDVERGAYIAPSADGQPAIIDGSPADKAGLKEKDIITKVDGTTVDQTHSLTSLLGQHMVGDRVSLTVLRDGKTIQISATLAAAPADS